MALYFDMSELNRFRSLDTNDHSITQLIQAASSGDQAANNALFNNVYQELKKIAKAHRRRWSGNNTLDTSALINEAYTKLADADSAFNDRTHFYATASKAMRQILTNYAERMSAKKRGGDVQRVTFSERLPMADDKVDEILSINEILTKLEAQNPRDCRLFECRVFGGMTIEETATALNVSPSTVKRDWSVISAWVYRELQK